MADAKVEQEWRLHGRTALDIINSQRSRKDQIKAEGFYPYFEVPTRKATQQDINAFVETLKGSQWLTVTTS